MSKDDHIRRVYSVGAVVERPDGIRYVKTKEGMVAEHRRIMQLKHGDFQPGWRVIHLDNNLRGEEEFNDINNLVIQKCRTTKWVKLKHSRVVFDPEKHAKRKYKEYVNP